MATGDLGSGTWPHLNLTLLLCRMADDPDLTIRVEGSTEYLGFFLDDKGHVNVDSVLEEFQAKQVEYKTKSGIWTVLGASEDGWSLDSFTAPTSLVIRCTPRAGRTGSGVMDLGVRGCKPPLGPLSAEFS